MNKEVRQLCRKLKNRGWIYKFTGSGHIKLIHPSGDFYITSSTPSDGWRWRQNVEREIRVIEERAWTPLTEDDVQIEEHDPEGLMKKAQEKLGNMAELNELFLSSVYRNLISRVRPWI